MRPGSRALVAVLALLGSLTPAVQAQNLLKNPSFETLRDKPTQFGHLFTDQLGWVYEQPGKLALGTIAHGGKQSFEIINGKGGKTRYQSDPMKLEAGRYRFTGYIRGLNVVGTYAAAMDLATFDGTFHPLKVPQTFGWTPITHVFQLDKPVDQGQLLIGLIGSGWVWIDDLSLEKVDDSVPLTKTPVLGKEESPIAPPAAIAGQATRCPDCGYRNSAQATACYACGSPIKAKAAASGPLVKVLFDFEDGKPGSFGGGKISQDNAPQGKNGLLVEQGAAVSDQPQDWSGYDLLKVDVFNPQDEPTMLLLEVRDEQSRDYWTRVNYSTVLPPGKSTVSLPTDIYVGEKSRPGRPLVSSKVNRLVLAPEKGPVVFDNIRLERLDVDSVMFEGLQAFDFGLPQSPVMRAYQAVDPGATYTEGRGYGWTGDTGSLRAFDGFQPDALFQDFVVASGATFRVDVPNGKYHLIMNIDSPGGYWGEVQTYTHRQVTANGKTVVDEKMNLDEFQKAYFRNAMQEDLPGLDTFQQYVQKMFNLKQFDVDVTDGKLELAFQSDGNWGITLSALVLYPADKAEQGRKFWDWTTEQRKSQFNDYFKQIVPKVTGEKAPAEGYVLFSRGAAQANAFDGPRPQEALPAEGLSYALAKGEEQAITFALQPGGEIGQIDLALSDFVGPNGAKLDAKTFQSGWIDYRINRVTMEGSVYSVGPRYWRPLPAPAAAKVTRNFWVRAKIAPDATPGKYAGKVTVKPANGQSKDIPVSITVLPFALDEVSDIAAGPWGAGIGLPWPSDAKSQQWEWQMFEKCLTALRANGFTTVTALPNIAVKAAAGKVTFDFTRADKEMKALRDHGYKQMISSYGASGLGYNMYGSAAGPDEEAAKNAGFADMESFLKAIYGGIEEHAAQANWAPVAWNLCDEPLGDAAVGSARNAALHDKVRQDLKLKYQTFMGATSMTGNDPKDPHYALVTSLTMPSLNLHDDASIKLIQDKGHQFSFYNGGNRWTYGRYMKALVEKYGLAYRVSWHLNVTAGNPYYALDAREDDYCWYNTNQQQELVPSLSLLGNILPGLNDYRYLCTLQRLVKEKANSPAAAEARKVYDQQINLIAGKDRDSFDAQKFVTDREAVTKAILSLIDAK